MPSVSFTMLGVAAPEVYWLSSPVYPNETLLVAGAGLKTTVASLSLDASCSRSVDGAQEPLVWEKAAKLVVPPSGCGPPCWFCLTSNDTVVHASPLNRPDVWWATGASPATPELSQLVPNLTTSEVVATLLSGDALQVYGRALAWKNDSTGEPHCVSAAQSPSPVISTELLLAPLDGGPTAAPRTLPSSGATCYEATFNTTSLAGRFSATLRTPWASSSPFTLTVWPKPPRPSRVRIDVVEDHRGDLLAALANASRLPPDVDVDIILGVHSYELTQPLSLRSRTIMRGAGTASTSLQFALPPDQGSAIVVGDNTSLLDASISLRTNRSGVAVIEMIGRAGFRASRLNVTQIASSALGPVLNVQGGRGFELTDSHITQSGGCAGLGVLVLHQAQRGLIRNNHIEWNCSAFGFDVSDQVVLESNNFTSLHTGVMQGGNYLATYDLYHHASNQR